MYGNLFDEEFISHISRVIACPIKDITKVHSLSKDPKQVKKWVDSNFVSEDAQIAEKGWIIAGMIRGKYNEYLASTENLHLLSHEFRKGIERKLKIGMSQPVPNSDVYFTNMLLGSAMIETSPERRVRAWVDNIANARKAIELKRIALINTSIESDAERMAAEAAKTIGLPSSPAILRRALDICASYGIPTLIGLMVAPWEISLGGIPIGAVIQQSYRHKRGVSLGDDIARFALSTKRRFRKLATYSPGRITHNLLGGGQD